MGEPAKYERVLLKISGEALMGQRDYGLDPDTVERIAREVKAVYDLGVEVCLVIGGGNIFRGLSGAAAGMERATADYMGMMATVINSLAMQNALEKAGLETRVLTAIEMNELAERRPQPPVAGEGGGPVALDAPTLRQVHGDEPLQVLLTEMVRRHASDLVLIPGSRPVLRVDGRLFMLDAPNMTGDAVRALFAPHLGQRSARQLTEAFSRSAGRPAGFITLPSR